MHKFRNISIKAFRVYNTEQVFDFSCGNDIANLVVIYAPNGYGKTSFNDAVEWGFTGEISRISKNKMLFDTANYEKGEILKNNDSNEEFGTVIFKTEDNSVLVRTTAKIDGRTKKDYLPGDIQHYGSAFEKFDEKLNEKFGKRNILAHDQIDSFLKAVTPEERYEELIPFWDEDNISKIYKGILSDYKEILKKITRQEEVKANIEKEILEYQVDANEYELLNSLILSLNKIACMNYILINPSTSKEDIDMFVSQIYDQHADAKTSKDTDLSKNSKTKFLILNYNSYIDNKSRFKTVNDRIDFIIKILFEIDRLENNKLKHRNSTKSVENLNYNLAIYQYLVQNYEVYLTLQNDILTNQKLIIERNKTIENLLDLMEKYKLNYTEIDYKLVKERQVLDQEKEFNNTVNSKISNYILSEKKILHYKSRANEISLLINTRNDKKSIVENKKSVLQYYLVTDMKTVLETIIDTKNAYYVSEIDGLQTIYKQLKDINVEIQRKEELYYSMGKLEQDINTIVKVGEHYVEESKATICPLCKQPYENHNELLKHIQSNLTEMMDCQSIKSDISVLKDKKENLEYTISVEYEEFLLLQKKTINEIDIKIHILEKKIMHANNIKVSMSNKLQFYQVRQNNIYLEFKEKNIHDFLSRRDYVGLSKQNLDYINEITNNISQLEREKQKAIDDNNEVEKNYILLKNEVEKLQVLIGSKKQDVTYQKYTNLLAELKQECNIELITYHMNETYKQVYDEKNEIERLKTEISELEGKYSLLNKDSTQSEKVNLMSELERINQQIQSYDETYYDVFGDEEKLNISVEKMENKRSALETNIKHYIEIENITYKIISMKNILDKNAIIQKKQLEIKNSNDSLDEYIAIYGEIEKVYHFSQQYIQEKINTVFNSDVINEIYGRIEPHPQLTEIQFVSDFSNDKSQIHIYTMGEERKKSAPVLYLSSAQLNILSLSIFYARALQNTATDFKTIFMDDPVENLDDMNILSFIDLVRTITEQLDMQIIMSTHDERFFNLLKRKMPENYYKSKFIELESYGVIKK